MTLAGRLLKDEVVFVDVAKVVSDLDEPGLFVACEVGAVNAGVSALAVVALAVPAVEGEADLLAGLGKEGNVNKASLEYSCNPNVDQSGAPSEETEETEEDIVIAFTYKVEVNKVDQNGDPVEGASFKLEKVLQDGRRTEVALDENASTGSLFSFKGLDDGDYLLTETAPEGYRSVDPIKFTVTAEHEVVWTDIDAREDVLTTLTGDVTTGEITLEAEEDLSGLTGTITNHQFDIH